MRSVRLAPFRTIPNAYETLMAYMKVNGLEHQEEKNVISCFEKSMSRTEQIIWTCIS